jgi:molybdopterin-guanine dinucleotide biosynthesis protein A
MIFWGRQIFYKMKKTENLTASEHYVYEAFNPKTLNYFCLELENWFLRELSMSVPLAVQLSRKTQIWHKGSIIMTIECTDPDVVRASCSCLNRPVTLFFTDTLQDGAVRLRVKNDRVQIHQVDLSGSDAVSYITNQIKRKCSMPLYGLILTGGKSNRMGKDKALMKYHGNKPQYKYLSDLLQPFCERVIFAVGNRDSQVSHEITEDDKVYDEFLHLGPLSGILSAFRKYPNVSFLVLAVDLPHVSVEAVSDLIDARNANFHATSYINSENKPEPLFSIWEGSMFPTLLKSLLSGNTCPQKILKSLDINKIRPANELYISNVNTQEEEQIARLIIKQTSK